MNIEPREAERLLGLGQIVAIPTETVYGLAARIDRPEAIAEIFDRKRRPANNPLIMHVAHFEQIAPHLHPGFEHKEALLQLSRALWPGPLTLVLPVKTAGVLSIVRAGLPTAGFRIPNHPLARELLINSGPLVAPSANLSGRPSATKARHVEIDFGPDFPVLDGGVCTVGIESSIVGWRNGQAILLRKGALSPRSIERALGAALFFDGADEMPICPGRLHAHYAPKARLVSDPALLPKASAVIGLKDRHYPVGDKCRFFYLGASDEDQKAATALFASLRSLDEEGIAEAFVDLSLPQWGLWPAICDRLMRAVQGSNNFTRK